MLKPTGRVIEPEPKRDFENYLQELGDDGNGCTIRSKYVNDTKPALCLAEGCKAVANKLGDFCEAHFALALAVYGSDSKVSDASDLYMIVREVIDKSNGRFEAGMVEETPWAACFKWLRCLPSD